ncbi:early endosome antigen 1-like, partial [Acanthaster planci]|uniref:Early endosome antigen 1-like n=1 Tax=Acanthaster planci TaxID=133434 RepID=A0A8B7Z271_ACAPL
MEALKRLKKKTKDAVEGSKGGSPQQSRQETKGAGEQEGFICPVCMVTLSSPEQLQVHWESVHNTPAAEPSPAPSSPSHHAIPASIVESSGQHSSMNRDGDVLALRQELEDLRVSLKEEKWYSEELKKEVEKLQQGQPTAGGGDVNLKRAEEDRTMLSSEVVLLRQQLAESMDNAKAYKTVKDAMEQKAATLATEVVTLKSCLDEEKALHNSLKEAMHQTQTAARIELQDRDARMKAVQSQLLQRPGADDVMVLKKELVSVQMLMDELSLANEADMKQLKEKHEDLKAEHEKLQASVADSNSGSEALKEEFQAKMEENATLSQQLSEVRGQLRDQESACCKLQQELDFAKQQQLQQVASKENQYSELLQQLEQAKSSQQEMEAEIAEVQKQLVDSRQSAEEQHVQLEQQLAAAQLQIAKTEGNVNEKDAQVSDLQLQLDMLQQQHNQECVNNDDLRSQLRERQSQIEDQQRSLVDRQDKLAELEMSLQKQRDVAERLEGERADLMAKIEAGEGISTAIQQLRQENECLQDQISELESTKDKLTEEHRAVSEDLHKQLQQTKAQVEDLTKQHEREEANLKETRTKLTTTQEKLVNTEADLKTKGELLFAAEASLATQRADLESHLRTSQAGLQDKQQELHKIQEQLEKTRSELLSTKEQLSDLEVKQTSLQEQLTTSNHQHSLLQNDLLANVSQLALVEENKKEMETQLNGQLQSLQVKLIDREEAFSKMARDCEQTKENNAALISGLEKELETTKTKLTETQTQLQEQVAMLEEQRMSIEESLSTTRQSLQQKEQEFTQLQQQKAAVMVQAAEKVEKLNADLQNTQTELSQAKTNLAASQQSILELTERLKCLETEKSELQDQFNVEQDVVVALKKQNTDQETTIAQKVELCAKLERQLESKDNKQKNLQQKIEVLEQEIAKSCEQCKNYESQVVKLQTQVK